MTKTAGPQYYTNNHFMSALKIFVYGALAINAYLFFAEESQVINVAGGNLDLAELITFMSATTDTVAWLVLVIIFELETSLIEDHHFTPALSRSLEVLRGLCYLAILYALYGYISKFTTWINISDYIGPDICARVGEQINIMLAYEEYVPLTATNCEQFSGVELVWLEKLQLVTTPDMATDGFRLAFIDVLNASTWVIVVVLIEVEMAMQSRKNIDFAKSSTSKISKAILYLTLFFCLLVWYIYGDLLDIWDAFLWLFAFFIIELNILDWATEIEEEKRPSVSPA